MTHPAEEHDEPLPHGIVHRDDAHFVLLHGDQDADSDLWAAVAWVGGSDAAPVVELAPDLGPELRQWIEQEIASKLRVDPASSTFMGFVDATGHLRPSWQGSLKHRVGTTANWYGDLHWAYHRGR